MHLGYNNNSYNYEMKDGNTHRTLNKTSCEKDLGVHVDSNLKFSNHIQKAVNKGNRLLGLVRRSFEYLDATMVRQLYTALVRPHLEYGNSVWSPQYKKDVLLLENVQRRATRLVPQFKDIEYEERLQRLNLPSLTYRRLRGDLIEVYKYLHNVYKIKETILPLHKNGEDASNEDGMETRGHTLKLGKAGCEKEVRKTFFSMRVVNWWNDLPEEVVTAPSINAFKNRVDKHLSQLKCCTNLPPSTKVNSKSRQKA